MFAVTGTHGIRDITEWMRSDRSRQAWQPALPARSKTVRDRLRTFRSRSRGRRMLRPPIAARVDST